MMVYTRDILRSNPHIFAKWLQLYDVTSALVGESDSINLLNLEVALQRVFGIDAEYVDDVAATEGLAALRDELTQTLYEQRILSQALITGALVPLPRYPIVFHFIC